MLKRLFLSSAAVTAMAAMAAGPALAEQSSAQTDDSWVAVSGEIAQAGPQSFVLDYGQGLITVDMEGWDWYNETSQLRAGEYVTVVGDVDDAFFDAEEIDAESVYAQQRKTFYYATPTERQDSQLGARFGVPGFGYASGMPSSQSEGTVMTLSGTVKSVADTHMVLDTGHADVLVDTSAMAYNPLDEIGTQRIEAGDVVQVNGQVDEAFFKDKELLADTVTSLHDANAGSTS